MRTVTVMTDTEVRAGGYHVMKRDWAHSMGLEAMLEYLYDVDEGEWRRKKVGGPAGSARGRKNGNGRNGTKRRGRSQSERSGRRTEWTTEERMRPEHQGMEQTRRKRETGRNGTDSLQG